MKTTLLILVLSALVFGCDDAADDTSGGTEPDAGVAVTPSSFTAEVAEGICDWMFGCCAQGVGDLGDRAACDAAYTADGAALMAGLDADYVVFDEARIPVCLNDLDAHIATIECDLFNPRPFALPTRCDDVLIGLQSEYQSCAIGAGASAITSDRFCEVGLVCQGLGEAAICGPLVGQYGSCDAATRCAEGLVCLDDGRCDEPVGAPCDMEGPFCRPGLFCEDGACASGPILGEICDPTIACALGLHCDDGTCVTDPVCE